MTCFFTPLSNVNHAHLVQRRAAFLHAVANLSNSLIPEVRELWCYGINALHPNRPTNDWDFIAFVSDDTAQARIDTLNSLDGPLDSDRRIGNQTLDIQVMRISDRSQCAQLIRAEGFCFWQKHITLSEHYAA